jgi:hypothetical protein
MKKIFLFLIFAVIAGNSIAQKSDYTVSFDGIGELKLGMAKAELEKLLRTKIVLKHIGVDESYIETIRAKYLGRDIELHLFGSEAKTVILEGIGVTDPVFKTADGIGIGTDQSMIIDKFEDHLLIMHPEYSPEGLVTNATVITLANLDNYRTAIIFTTVNKKVVSIRVAPTPEFRDRE